MSLKQNQNEEVYVAITTSSKSLLQLYIELKDERDQLAVALACKAIGIPYVSSNELFLKGLN
jgi:glutaredoxin-related protein